MLQHWQALPRSCTSWKVTTWWTPCRTPPAVQECSSSILDMKKIEKAGHLLVLQVFLPVHGCSQKAVCLFFWSLWCSLRLVSHLWTTLLGGSYIFVIAICFCSQSHRYLVPAGPPPGMRENSPRRCNVPAREGRSTEKLNKASLCEAVALADDDRDVMGSSRKSERAARFCLFFGEHLQITQVLWKMLLFFLRRPVCKICSSWTLWMFGVQCQRLSNRALHKQIVCRESVLWDGANQKTCNPLRVSESQ